MKNCIITGASKGFGKSIAIKFYSTGYGLSLCSRNLPGDYLTPYSDDRILKTSCDVSDEIQVNNLIDESIKKFKTIDCLILNAGVYGPMGPLESTDLNEWIASFNINLYGVVYPCKKIIEHFKLKNKGKIIVISGGGATSPMPFVSSYAASKAAVIRFMESLSLELKDFNIDINAVAPGPLVTDMMDQAINAGPEVIGKEFYEKNKKWKETEQNNIAIATDLVYYLTTDESNGITGKLISAKWDNWKTLHEKINTLKTTDLYTLRRIVPEDRGYINF
jgi:NAD(P)-dependent dehydrogenase (short-subunit alcohol dehydrogenase family)